MISESVHWHNVELPAHKVTCSSKGPFTPTFCDCICDCECDCICDLMGTIDFYGTIQIKKQQISKEETIAGTTAV